MISARKSFRHVDWSGLNWSRPDMELAGEIGCSRQYVLMMRRRHAPDTKSPGRRIRGERIRKESEAWWTPLRIHRLKARGATDFARRSGVSLYRAMRKQREWYRHGIVWTEEMLEDMKNLQRKDFIAKHGIGQASYYRKKAELKNAKRT